MLLFLDIETTGFDSENDEILEISAVRYDEEQQKIIAEFDTILQLQDGVEVSPMIEGLTGISTEMCRNEGIPTEEAQRLFADFILDDDIITGHNIQFDTRFLKAKGFIPPEKNYAEIDTFILSVLVLGQEEESHSLEILSEKYGIVHENAHRAMSDVLANLDFYLILEKIYARTFSHDFQKFLQEKNFDFPEKYFFEQVEKKQSILAKQILPTITASPKPVFHFSDTRDDFFSETFSHKKSVFFESFDVQKYVPSLIQSAQKSQKKISLFYPPNQKQEFFQIFLTLSDQFPNLQFIAPPEKMINTKKYQDFLQKDNFDKFESIVATKIFRGKELKQELSIRFMGEEWKCARNLLGKENEDLSTIPYKILPFSQSFEQKNEGEIRVFFGSEELESLLLQKNQEKFFSKRLQEDFSGSQISKSLNSLITTLATNIREEKGENPYSVSILWKDLVRMDFFSETKKLFEEIYEAIENNETISKTQKNHCLQWKQFFHEPKENEIKVIELFPDNAISIDTINPFFEESFQNICAQDESTLFFGKAFPKNTESKATWSFPLHKEFTHESDEKFFPSEVFLPNPQTMPRDATPQEIAQCIIKQWEKGENEEQTNFIISLTSNKNISEVKEFLRKPAEEKGIKIFSRDNGGRGKIKKMMSRCSKKIVIGNAKFIEGLDLSPENFSGIFIHKLQFDHPKQPLIQAQRKRFFNDFEEFSIPRAKMKLERDIFQFSYDPKGKNIKIFLGDGRIADSSTFYSTFQKVFPENTEIKTWEES
jgi:DNA polymerase III epsilon subunit-like protein